MQEIKNIINKVYLGEASEVLNMFPDKFIQVVMTSPAYYGNSRWSYKSIEDYMQQHVKVIKEIYRVLKDDGVVFWNINDSYVQKDQEYTDLCAYFYFAFKNCGFHKNQKTVIWKRDSGIPTSKLQDYYEFVMVFSKGASPKFDKNKVNGK